jgi:5'-phosphate synthase pdxT subunit
MKPLRIGVLGFQGDIEEHVAASRAALEAEGLKGDVVLVKSPEDAESVDAIIIPGGESTAMGLLASFNGTLDVIKKRASSGLPALGTCAGLILLSKKSYDRVLGERRQPLLSCLDVLVERNTYGRQGESFEAEAEGVPHSEGKLDVVFVRAPAIRSVGPDVQVLAKMDGEPIAVRQGNVVGTTYHPELSGDLALHRWLVRTASGRG